MYIIMANIWLNIPYSSHLIEAIFCHKSRNANLEFNVQYYDKKLLHECICYCNVI